MPEAAETRLMRWGVPALVHALRPLQPELHVEIVPSIGSTNTELMQRARAGRCAATLLVAEQQTAGRGRLGSRQWVSRAGDSLTFSLGLPLAAHDWSGLSLAVGLSLAQSLQDAAVGAPGRIGIKWPNDLWLDGARKLTGILIETTSAGAQQSRYVVIGIGINVRVPPPAQHAAMRTPPAWLQEIAPHLDAPAALACIAPPLLRAIADFARRGFAPQVTRFAHYDVLRGRDVVLGDGSTAQARGVDASGALLVRTANGAVQAISSTEVGVRPLGRVAL